MTVSSCFTSRAKWATLRVLAACKAMSFADKTSRFSKRQTFRHAGLSVVDRIFRAIPHHYSKSSFVLWAVLTQALVVQKQWLVKLWVPWQWSRQKPQSELVLTVFFTATHLQLGLGEGLVGHTCKFSTQEPEAVRLKFHNQGAGKTTQLVKCLQNPHTKPGMLRASDPSPREIEMIPRVTGQTA